MRTKGISPFLSWVLLLAIPAYSLDDQKTAHAKYDELATKVLSGDLNVDWKALRLAARVGEVYGDYDPYDATKRMNSAFEKGDYEEGLKIAHEIEHRNIADVEAHLVAWGCLNELERRREADTEWRIAQALVQSIIKPGDGKSAGTAWFAVGIREEYLVMKVMRVQPTRQHSVKQSGHYYDVVQVSDESGKESVLWFNTDTDIELLGRAGDEGHPIY